jgi:hypothetical protein
MSSTKVEAAPVREAAASATVVRTIGSNDNATMITTMTPTMDLTFMLSAMCFPPFILANREVLHGLTGDRFRHPNRDTEENNTGKLH